MLTPVIYLRQTLSDVTEFESASKHFPVVDHRGGIPSNSLVIPRYSALPYYAELEKDVAELGSCLINTYKQHQYVADLQNWYADLTDLTPRTWFFLDQLPDTGPFVLKGATNSKKFQWDTHMYAKNKQDAVEVACRLYDDGLIGYQSVYAREYVPLKRLATGLRGLPISSEYRVFVLDGNIVASGFYWSSHLDIIDLTTLEEPPKSFLDTVVERVRDKIRFFVVDVAQTESGAWIVIELNDAQQAGLSTIDSDVFYANLRAAL